jgi:ketosteroid isomerase-like protein
MSRENVDVVRAATEAMAARDGETALNALDQDIEWHGAVGGFDEGRVARGHDEVVQAFADYFRFWERVELRADRYIDAGGEEVIVFIHEIAKGRASGIVVETDLAVVNTVRNRKIVRVRSFLDRNEALEAVGLRE